MRRLEQGAALLMMAVALLVGLGTAGLPVWTDFSPGDRFVPLIVSGATLILATLALIEARRRPANEPADLPRGADARRVLVVAGAIAGFAAVAALLGFVATTALFVLAVLLGVLRRPVLPSALAAAITAGIVHAIFVAWLGVRLPAGLLGL